MEKQIKIPLPLQILRKVNFPRKKGILDKLFGARLAIQPIGVVETHAGSFWKIDPANPCHRWMIYDDYADAAFLHWARKNIPSNGVIVDSGSNIGQFLPYFSKIIPDGKILAFEPSPTLCHWIQESIKLNEQLPIQLYQFGLGEMEEAAKLFDYGAEVIHGLWGKISKDQGDPIELIRLDTVLGQQNIQTVDLWKLDVEGFEVEALRGAGKYLEDRRIKHLYIELAIKEDNHIRILDYMEQIGYEPYLFNAGGKLELMQTVNQEQVDALFIAK